MRSWYDERFPGPCELLSRMGPGVNGRRGTTLALPSGIAKTLEGLAGEAQTAADELRAALEKAVK